MKKSSFLLPVIFALALVSCGDGDGLMNTGPTWDKSSKEITLTIESIEPQMTEAGKTVMLQGMGLDASKDTVMVGNTGVEPDGSGEETTEINPSAGGSKRTNKLGTIIFTVPKDVDVGEIEIKVKREETLSNAVTLEVVAAEPAEDEAEAEDDSDDESGLDVEDPDDEQAADNDHKTPVERKLVLKKWENRSFEMFVNLLQTLKRKGIDPASLGNN